MLTMFLRWIIYALLIIFISWIIPGISVNNFLSAMLACVVIAFVNIFLKPFLELISLPVNILTLGIFSLIINALLFMLIGALTPGFEVDGFWSAFFGSILLSILAGVIQGEKK